MLYQLIVPSGTEDKPTTIDYPEGFKFRDTKNTLGAVISEALKYIYPLAGIILFFMLLWAGFEYLTAAGDEEKIKGAQQKITWSVIGFIVLFAAFWVMRILQTVFGFKVL